MIEVEAKVRISSLREFRRRAQKIGKYIGRVKKVDDYYTLEKKSKYPRKSLRIRKVGRRYIINFKQRISYSKGVHAKKETEFETSDVNGFLDLIKDFGFRKWLRKEKTTELYKIKKNFHIELNKVKGLGWFAEVEYLTNLRGIDRARKEVRKVLKELGVGKKDLVKDGYTKLLWDKKK